MTVSVVIPAWNDAEGVQAVLETLADVAVVSEVIVVDDCSQTPLETQLRRTRSEAAEQNLQILRHAENRGGGAARNTGLNAVTQPYVIFLDSDDLPTSEYGAVLEAFVATPEPFDFAMFRHLDSRELHLGRKSGLPVDERSWDQLPRLDVPQVMSEHQKCEMAAVSAYPWNKLYRTGFLKEHEILCTEIPVHNDIELHWVSFLLARRVLYSHHTGITHFVADHGNRITNRKGAERLRVFEALDNVSKRIEGAEITIRMQLSYWRFVNKLMRWIPNNLTQERLQEFHILRRAFVLDRLSPGVFKRLALNDPHLSTALLDFLEEGEA